MWELGQQHSSAGTALQTGRNCPRAPDHLPQHSAGPTMGPGTPRQVHCQDKQKAGFSSPSSALLTGKREKRNCKRQCGNSSQAGKTTPNEGTQALPCSLINEAIPALTHRLLHGPEEDIAGHEALRGPPCPSCSCHFSDSKEARPCLCPLLLPLPPWASEVSPRAWPGLHGTGSSSCLLSRSPSHWSYVDISACSFSGQL